MSSKFLKLVLLLITIALVHGYPAERDRVVGGRSAAENDRNQLLRQGFLSSYFWDIGNEPSNMEGSREKTPFERTKELKERQNREPIVWHFNSYGRVKYDPPIDPVEQYDIDDSQIRCLGLQCLRIMLKLDPVVANCEYFDLNYLLT